MAREDILTLLLLLREKVHYFTTECIIKYSFSVDAFYFFNQIDEVPSTSRNRCWIL